LEYKNPDKATCDVTYDMGLPQDGKDERTLYYNLVTDSLEYVGYDISYHNGDYYGEVSYSIIDDKVKDKVSNIIFKNLENVYREFCKRKVIEELTAQKMEAVFKETSWTKEDLEMEEL
jgi:hypothetical protein